MSDLFNEVDEALKQERLENLWKKYGKIVIGVLTGVVLGTAANSGYTSWKTEKNIESTDLFINTTHAPNYTSDDLVNITPKLQDNISGISLLTAAQKELKAENTQKAVDIYNQITSDRNYDPSVTYIAEYMITSHDKNISQEEKLNRFTAMLSDTKNPYIYRAYLDAALLEAELNKNFTKARAYLDVIAQAEYVPQSLKAKAQSIDIVYAIKEAAQKQN